MHEKIDIAGIKIDFGLKVGDILSKIDVAIKEGGGGKLISTVNPEFIVTAWEDQEFASILNSAYLSLPDGVGTLLAKDYLSLVSKLDKKLFVLDAFVQGTLLGLKAIFDKEKYLSRLSGSEIIYDICKHAEQNNYSIGLLGGWEKDFFGKHKKVSINIAEVAGNRLKEMFPNLKIVCASSNFKASTDSDISTVEFIQDNMKNNGLEQLDILFVGYGHSKQEKWIVRNIDKIPAKVGIGVGGTLDMVAGSQKKVPNLIKKINLEWLYRLLLEPWRIRRVFKAFPYFPFVLFLKSIQQKH